MKMGRRGSFAVWPGRTSLGRLRDNHSMKIIRTFCYGLLLTGLIAGCGSEVEKKPAEIRPVLAEAVGTGSAEVALSYPGTVAARHESELAFRVDGRVTARKVDAGATVKAGQTLATLDAGDYALAETAAASQLAAAQSELGLAQLNLKRQTELRYRNFISQVELDRTRTQLETTEARVRQFEAEARRQGNQRDYTRLDAPHAGVVTMIEAEPGQVVASGRTVARVARTDAFEVDFSVPEADLAAVRAAKSFDVHLWALPRAKMNGTLRELAPAADPATRTYRARVAITKPDPAMRLGMTATVALDGAASAHPTLPQSALFRVSGAPQVWVLDRKAGRVAARGVSLGALVGERVEIVAGLAPGEWVVTAGVHALTPDQTVRLGESVKP